MCGETDISRETIDDFTSKLINYGKESKEKVSFDVDSSIVSCEISVLRLRKWTFDVSKRSKNCGKNPLYNDAYFFQFLQSGKQKQARLDDSIDDELEPRIIAGDVTSTVLFCWMAAIMEKSAKQDSDQFICTGTLVEPDLIVTSASCTLRMFETGVDNFHVVLGDANLQIDLPFGVQIHEISEVIVHENYRPDDSFHYEDIGLIKIKTYAKMETTVCLLCLPDTFKSFENDNCTVVGYGRPSTAALNQFSRGKVARFCSVKCSVVSL